MTYTEDEERAFFSALRLGNGTYKTTSDGRLNDVNALVMEQWQRLGIAPRNILDVGASSGISSLEWLQTLTRGGHEARMMATDLCHKAWLLRVGLCHEVLVDKTGHVLQHLLLGMTIRAWRRRRDYVTGYALLNGLLNSLAARRQRACSADMLASRQEVLLVSPRARNHAGLSFAEDDLLGPNPSVFVRQFDAIRAANVLNRAYFSTAELRTAVLNLRDRLTGPNTFFVVNRTRGDGTNHGTLFRLNDQARFEVVTRWRAGSEIEDIVLAI